MIERIAQQLDQVMGDNSAARNENVRMSNELQRIAQVSTSMYNNPILTVFLPCR